MPHLLNVTKGFESVCLFYSPLQPIATQSRRREGKGEANFRMIINKITLKVNLTLNRIPIENQLEMIYFDTSTALLIQTH